MCHTLCWVPLLRPHASWTHTCFDLNRMIVPFGNPPHDCSVPLVPVSPTREYRRAALERHMFGRSDLEATHVSINHKITHVNAGDTVGYISQHRVEAFQLCTAGFVLNNAPVLAQTSEVEVSYNMWMHNERRS